MFLNFNKITIYFLTLVFSLGFMELSGQGTCTTVINSGANSGVTITYTYNDLGQLIQQDRSNGFISTYTYSPSSGRLSSRTIQSFGTEFVYTFTAFDSNNYPTNANFTITDGTNTAGPFPATYSYSSDGRLLSAMASVNITLGSSTIIVGNETNTYDSDNKLISTDFGSFLRTYDGNCSVSLSDASFVPVPEVPVPTLSQWGLLILGLLVLNMGVMLIYRRGLV